MKKQVKKLIDVKKVLLLSLALPLLVPISAVTAHDTVPVTTESAIVEIQPTFSAAIVATPTETQKVEITVVDSTYLTKQKADRAAAIAASAALVKATPRITATSEEKSALAQKAASAYQIDWKLLMAVWQIESGQQMVTTVRSYAGAAGPCQFMPGTWRAYQQDGNGDGVKDVHNAQDCLFGAAKLLSVNGASSGKIVQALLRYNHSMSYVNKVLALAERQ